MAHPASVERLLGAPSWGGGQGVGRKRSNRGIQFHPVPWLRMSGAVLPLSHKSQHAQGQFHLHFCIINCYGLSPFSFVSLDLEDAHGPPSLFHFRQITVSTGKPIKAAAVLLQAWSGPEGSRKLKFPDFMTTAQDGGKVVSLTHRPPLPPGNTSGTHFC